MSRVRRRCTYTNRVFHYSTSDDPWGWGYEFSDPVSAEYIDDAVGSKAQFHACHHHQDTWDAGSIPDCVDYVNNVIHHYEGFPSDMMGDPSWGPTNIPVTGSRAGAISRRALLNATKQVPMEVSIANFLLELKNPKELLPRMDRWLSRHGPSDALLWWKFGIEPTIRDVKAMIGLLGRTRKRLEHLRKVNGRVVTIRYRDNFTVDTPIDESGPYWIGSWPEFRTRVKTTVKAVVNMSVNYQLQGLDAPTALLDAMGAAMGLSNPAAIVWEAIPFSFVVDWFVRIGDWIDQHLEIEPFKGSINVVGCSYSYKWTTDRIIYAPGSSDGDWSVCGTYTTKGYHRESGLPSGSLWTEGLTSQQQILGAALLNSVGHCPRKRRRVK